MMDRECTEGGKEEEGEERRKGSKRIGGEGGKGGKGGIRVSVRRW